MDTRVSRLADLVAGYSVGVRKGDFVVISGSYQALPLVRELYRAVLERGGHPVFLLAEEELEETFLRYASRHQLEWVSPLARMVVEKSDVRISIVSSTHTRHLASTDPEKLRLRMAARRELTQVFMKRDEEGSLRWNVVPYPTKALAQEANMGLLDFEDFVYRACKLDSEDPVGEWRRQAEMQDRVISLLSKADELRLVAPGTDLLVKVGGRRWVNDDGRKNMPGGEVFTGPVEDATEGVVEFEYPAVWRGIVVEGVRLRFSGGRVVEASARSGEEALRKILDTDEGARRLGEFAFGLNYSIDRFVRMILTDEKIGGTVHMALGAGYRTTGSRNESSIHWDMIKDMRRGKVYADGDLVYENGRFLLELA